MRYGAKVHDGTVTDVLVLADGDKGDAAIAAFDLVEQDGVHPKVGWLWDGSQFTAPPAPAPTWDDVRAERDLLLGKSDWTVLADAPLTAAQKTAWKAYRQQLRDLPQTYDDPEDVTWPTAP